MADRRKKKAARRPTSGRANKTAAAAQSSGRIWVATAMPGAEDLLALEIQRRSRGQAGLLPSQRSDEYHFLSALAVSDLLSLALCHSLHVRLDFPVLRPRGLMSPEHLQALVAHLRATMQLTPSETFSGFRFDAAGADSPAFKRLATAVEGELGMNYDPVDGDLVIGARPGDGVWEILCRVGNRPLSSRSWRTANYRGALNANFAAAMVELTRPQRTDHVLNTMCGSGTILIERIRRRGVASAIGVDHSSHALAAARSNIAQAGNAGRIQLLQADACCLPHPPGTFDVILADLPWGRSHGTQTTNPALYRETFGEISRVSRPSARLVILTEDVASLASLDQQVEAGWTRSEERIFVQRGFRPTCRVYTRT